MTNNHAWTGPTKADEGLSEYAQKTCDNHGITVDYLRKRLTYDPESGDLHWLDCGPEFFKLERHYKHFLSLYAGKVAGKSSGCRGYKRIMINGKAKVCHRIAWAIYYGFFPRNNIDHINGDKSDNRISNLRDVDQSVNVKNTFMYKVNSSGFTGVHWHKSSGKWAAQIGVNGTRKHLGLYETKELARDRYLSAKKELGFSDRHGLEKNNDRLHD